MEQVLVWLWDTSQGHGVDFIVVLLAIASVTTIYSYFQNQLIEAFQTAPNALIVFDAKSCRLLYANAQAKQLLGIRRVGKAYLLPDNIPTFSLLDLVTQACERKLSVQGLNWQISESRSFKVDLTGSEIVFKKRRAWVLNFTSHQASSAEVESELQSLSVIQSAVNNLSEFVFIKDNQGQLISSNRAFKQFWKGREEEGHAEIVGVIKGRASKRSWTTSPDGRSCLLEHHQNVLFSDSGEKLGTLGITHDVTDWHDMQKSLRDEMERRKDTEVALAQRDTILQNILESSPDSIGIFNENMVYQACNKPFVEALGITNVEDLIGKRLQDVIPDEHYQQLSETDNKVLYEGQSLRYVDRVVKPGGKHTWYDVVKSPFKDPASGTNGVLIMARDVTERYLAEQKLEEANYELERLSFVDSLTQISNRRRFDEQLETLWHLHSREKQPLTVMLCDIDFFKGYNDHYGHQLGDEALIKVASVFQSVLPRSSDCVARYGGEEFGFILPNTTASGALKVAERIHQGISELKIEHQASQVAEVITASIGLVSLIPKPQGASDSLVAFADSALYQAKANGRNQTCVHHTSED